MFAVDYDLEAVVGVGPGFVGALLLLLSCLCLVVVTVLCVVVSVVGVIVVGVVAAVVVRVVFCWLRWGEWVVCVLSGKFVLWCGIRGQSFSCSDGRRWFANCRLESVPGSLRVRARRLVVVVQRFLCFDCTKSMRVLLSTT